MQSLFFWKNWNTEYRTLWHILIVVFIAAIAYFWYGYFQGAGTLVHWDKYQNQKTIEGVTHTFDVGNFELAVPIESYVTHEFFNASALHPNLTASYSFTIVLILAGILLFTIITTLPRFWYYVGTGLFVLFLVSLRLDVLALFGERNQIPTILTAVIFIAVSFYFNAFNTSARFYVRLFCFLALTALLGVLIYFFADVTHPFLYLSISGYIPALILTVLFILMGAHEIMASFVYLTSQSTASSKSLMHFTIISVIYLVNVVLAYMHEAGLIYWNFIFINLYLLFTISSVLSIWGYRKREALYDNIVNFYPFGALFIATLLIVAFTTTGMFLNTYNDVALKIIRDIIVFSHVGFGAIFLLYFISNFVGLMAVNQNVYKVLYSPTRMPYATFRIAGLIATLAFVLYSDWHTYVYQATAGIFNSMGNLQLITEGPDEAEPYYKKARAFVAGNFVGNYALAGIETQRYNLEQAHAHYRSINRLNPNAYALVNDANLYLLEDNYVASRKALVQAQQKISGSGVIQNNLGYAYLRSVTYDSAFLFFDQALADKTSRQSAGINITALLAQTQVVADADSLLNTFTASDAIASNVLLIAAQSDKKITTPLNPLKDDKLNLFSATLLNNYMVYKLTELDTTFLTQAFVVASDSVNTDYTEALKATLAHGYYYQNNVARALAIMGEVAYITQSMQGKFNYTMGLWALEQGNAPLAVKCFAYSVEQDYKDAKRYNAIALTEARMHEQALEAVATLLDSKSENDREIGKQIRHVLTLSHTDALNQNDLIKYQYARYRIGLTDSLKFNQLINTIENTNYKALMLLEMAQRQFDAGSTRKAIRYFNALAGLRFTDKNLFDKINHFELELLASRNEVRLLAAKINEGITFPQQKQLQKMLYTALISEVSGDTVTAENNYRILATYNPFFEEGIIAAARYYSTHGTDSQRAYTILAEAKHINPGSVRLLMAYITEAQRIGFDDFAADAFEELEELRTRQR